jgi:hypothetical protein
VDWFRNDWFRYGVWNMAHCWSNDDTSNSVHNLGVCWINMAASIWIPNRRFEFIDFALDLFHRQRIRRLNSIKDEEGRMQFGYILTTMGQNKAMHAEHAIGRF